MGNPDQDPGRWISAGGNPDHLELLARAGRIAVFSDDDARCMAGIHPDQPTLGAIGDWVGPPSILAAAEAWLAAQGCTEARGPMLLCSWFPHRANLGPLTTEPIQFEPTEPGARWLEAGYREHAHYLSILAAHEPNIRAGTDRAAALATSGWSLQPLEARPDPRPSLELLHAIATRVFGTAEDATTVDLDVLIDFYHPWIDTVDPGLSRIAQTPTGEPAGFVLAVPETSQPGRSWFQILSLAVVPEHRHRGVAGWLVAAAHQAARRAGIETGVHAMVRADEHSREGKGWYRGDILRRYALFHKPLSPATPPAE